MLGFGEYRHRRGALNGRNFLIHLSDQHLDRATITAPCTNKPSGWFIRAKVQARVLRDDSSFEGAHAGEDERLYDNISPGDANGTG